MNVPETFFTVHEEAVLFGISCLCGVLLGVCYDVFRALRLMIRHNFALVFAEDLVFFIGYCTFLAVFASVEARGGLRVYFIIGNLLGFVLYLATVGSIIIRTVQKLLSLIKTVVGFLFYPINKIIAFVGKKLSIKFVKTSKNLVNHIKNIKKHLINRAILLYNKTENK